jgi:hypothetical protein
MRFSAWGVVFLAMTLFTACTDGSTSPFDPLGETATRSVSFALATSFAPAATAQATGEIESARVTVINAKTGAVIDVIVIQLDPNADEWSLNLSVDIPLQEDFRVELLIELLSFPDGVETVEWSGKTAPIAVQPGTAPTEIRQVGMNRGPPANLGVTAVGFVNPPSLLFVGDQATLNATVTGGGSGTTVFFISLDPEVADVTPGGLLTALAPGNARIVVEAGPKADTIAVRVDAFPLPPEEELAKVGPGVDDVASRLVTGLQDQATAGQIAAQMGEINAALASKEGQRVLAAIQSVRTLISNYGGGSADLRTQDSPELSLIELTLDFVSSVLESER